MVQAGNAGEPTKQRVKHGEMYTNSPLHDGLQKCRGLSKIADYGYVMETGRISLTGTGTELLANEQVKELYLGKSKQ